MLKYRIFIESVVIKNMAIADTVVESINLVDEFMETMIKEESCRCRGYKKHSYMDQYYR